MTMFALVQSEKGRPAEMSDSIPSIINSERSALAMTNTTGRGDGGGVGSGGSGGRGHGGPPSIDRDNLHCTHCGSTRHTRDTYWNLHGRPHWANTTFAVETSGDNTGSGSRDTVEGKREVKVKCQ